MTKKFNFLNRRTAASKAAADLRQRFPKRSAAWIKAKAAQVAGPEDVSIELRAPASSSSQRGTK